MASSGTGGEAPNTLATKCQSPLNHPNRPQLSSTAPNRPLNRRSFVTDRDIQWHGEAPSTPDWSEASRLVAYTLADGQGGGLYIAFNTSHKPRWVGCWHRGGCGAAAVRSAVWEQ